ncbi:MAG: hypothetical protein ACQSGP_25000 [Frankia sp.]
MLRRVHLMSVGAAVLVATTLGGATAASASSSAPSTPAGKGSLTCPTPPGFPSGPPPLAKGRPGKGQKVIGHPGSAPGDAGLTTTSGPGALGEGPGNRSGTAGPGAPGRAPGGATAVRRLDTSGAKAGDTVISIQGGGTKGGPGRACVITLRFHGDAASQPFVTELARQLGVSSAKARGVLTAMDKIGTVQVSSRQFAGIARSAGVSPQKLVRALETAMPKVRG